MRGKRRKSSKKPAAKPAKKRVTQAARARSKAAQKGWETRRRQAAEREAQKKARARAKKAKAKAAGERHARRSLASQRGWATRRAREKLRAGLVRQEAHVAYGKDLEKRGQFEAKRTEWYRTWVKERIAWATAKGELLESVEDDMGEYERILEEIADDEAIDWQIAYGPEDVAIA